MPTIHHLKFHSHQMGAGNITIKTSIGGKKTQTEGEVRVYQCLIIQPCH
uniref:Uncharacterized protein n=1 Tax=Anguilla anguilla TaxID=7936 RepID=A0A0E9P999_ANGAN